MVSGTKALVSVVSAYAVMWLQCNSMRDPLIGSFSPGPSLKHGDSQLA